MRRVTLVPLLLLAACSDDVCVGVDGTCVALAVRGAVQIDGLDLTLSGAMSGHQVAPPRAAATSLPAHLALQLPSSAKGALHIEAVAVRLGEIVGEGVIDLVLSSGSHSTAVIELGAPSVDGNLGTTYDLACPSGTTRCAGVCCGDGHVCTSGQCLACAADAVACDNVCCATGEVCRAGACAPPYATAHLYVYLCPNFNSGCSSSGFSLDASCSSPSTLTPGTCHDTGLVLQPSTSYQLATCMSCPGSCGAPLGFMTPAGGFSSPSYYPGISFFCGAACTAPTSCP